MWCLENHTANYIYIYVRCLALEGYIPINHLPGQIEANQLKPVRTAGLLADT